MKHRLHRTVLFILYQITLGLGIVLFPLALLAEQIGVSVPVDQLIDRLKDAYVSASDD